MIILNILKLFLLFFIIYSPQQLTEGMHNPPEIIRSGISQLLEPINPRQFSLTDLSFIRLILDSFQVNDLYDDHLFVTNQNLLNILQRYGDEIINREYIIPSHNRRRRSRIRQAIQNIKNIYGKIERLFNHFNDVHLTNYQNDINAYFITQTNQSINQTREERINFIFNRIIDYGCYLNDQIYIELLNNYNIGINIINNEIIPNYDSLWTFSDEQINVLFNYFKFPSQKEINLLFLYYLYSIVRTIIILFIRDNTNYYINLFNLLTEQFHRQISIVAYMRNFDDLEVYATQLYNNLRTLHIFTFLDNTYGNGDFIKTINIIETNFAERYPVSFVSANYENINEINQYMRVISTFLKPEDNNAITQEEYNNLLPYQIEGQTTFDLYRLYNSEYLEINFNLRNKIEEYFINEQLIAAVNNGDIEYSLDREEFIDYEEGRINISPKIRPINIPNPNIGEGTCRGNDDGGASSSHQGEASTSNQGEANTSHQDPGPSSGRRRQRDDGNGGGNGDGNGGSGPRQRGRRNGGGNGSRGSHGRGRNGGNGNEN
ncbi:hypothetical protein Mgra_00004789 [Meloidogyne graminicola]|uniref:Uncharacterized protein n=1 Tax=Meloidogyne graminicola TaxID=189291 RepID=A0A8S9ZS59_9BILA|nr:hypothetical protein Mgra_00004789 [Meloidogyne graminicola]